MTVFLLLKVQELLTVFLDAVSALELHSVLKISSSVLPSTVVAVQRADSHV